MTTEEIRRDLKEIRYYYSRKKRFDGYAEQISQNVTARTAERYNEAVRNAPPQLYEIYACLYVRNYTQESLGNELGYTLQHINALNKRLLLFLQNELKDEENGNEK